MKTIFFALLALVLNCRFCLTVKGGDSYEFDPAASTIAFQVHHFLGTAKGKFREFSGKIDLDRDQAARSSVSARIQVSSIDTAIRKRDEHLRSAEFFNAAKFPQITFKSSKVARTGDETADITGDLTMHGVTKPIVLHVRFLGESGNGRSRWQVSTAPIDRRDFGLAFSSAAEAVSGIGREVTTDIQIDAIGSRPASQ